MSPVRAGEAYRPQLEGVRDLRMLEATDQNLLEVLQVLGVLEAESRMLEAPEELMVR